MTEDQRDLLKAARESLAAANVGRVPQRLHGVLIAAEKLRITSDYGDMQSVTVEQAEGQIAHAEEFVAVAEHLIGPLPPPEPGAR